MPLSYRIAFLGSGAFACPSLDSLIAGGRDEIIAVVCQPDKPCGRALKSAPCATKRHLADAGVKIITPKDINAPSSLHILRELAPDLFVVVAYGQILKPETLSIPKAGCINVHGSLLPKYRGAAPIQWAIACGETTTGVTTMFLNEEMDAGNILGRRSCPILPADTTATLHDRLAQLGADLLMATLNDLRHGRAIQEPQDPAQATFAPKLKKQHGRLDWQMPALDLANRIRAFTPWPGSFFEWPRLSGKHVTVLRAKVASVKSDAAPGAIIKLDADGFLVQTSRHALHILEVKPANRSAMPAPDFARGRSIKQNDLLG